MKSLPKEPNVLVDTYTRAVRRFKEDGIVRGSTHLLLKLTSKFVRYNCIFFFTNSKNEPLSSGAVSKLIGVVVDQASRKDIVRFEYCRLRDRAQYRRKAYEGLDRLRRGDICFLAKHDGRLIAKAWTTMADTWFISELETDESIGPESITIFDCATIPEYRGKRVFPLILRNIITKYPDRRKVIYCEKRNLSSRRAIEHDFTLEKKLYFFKILGVSFRWSR
jgi:GNAT superfamily N-acetyltransferase